MLVSDQRLDSQELDRRVVRELTLELCEQLRGARAVVLRSGLLGGLIHPCEIQARHVGGVSQADPHSTRIAIDEVAAAIARFDQRTQPEQADDARTPEQDPSGASVAPI